MRSARTSSPLAVRPSKMPLASGGAVLEQAVDPRIVVGVEREGRGVHAAAAGGVGDDRAATGRCRSGRFRGGRGAFPASRWSRAMRSRRSESLPLCTGRTLGVQLVDQGFHLADVLRAALVVNGAVGGHDEADRGHLTAATARAVAAGGGVVVGTVEHQALGVAIVVEGAPSTKRSGVFGVRLRNSKRVCSVSSTAASCCARSARPVRRPRRIPGSPCISTGRC